MNWLHSNALQCTPMHSNRMSSMPGSMEWQQSPTPLWECEPIKILLLILLLLSLPLLLSSSSLLLLSSSSLLLLSLLLLLLLLVFLWWRRLIRSRWRRRRFQYLSAQTSPVNQTERTWSGGFEGSDIYWRGIVMLFRRSRGKPMSWFFNIWEVESCGCCCKDETVLDYYYNSEVIITITVIVTHCHDYHY